METNRLVLAMAIARKSKEPLHSIALNVKRLAEIGRALKRLAEKECNDPSFGQFDENRRDRLVSDATKICEFYGLTANPSNDPRGYCLKIVGIGTYNTMGGLEEGWGIE